MFTYVASPYSDKDREVEITRYDAVMEFMTHSVKADPDTVLYSPILHCHVWANRHDLPKDAAWWRRHNLSILQKASVLYVVGLEGWKESVGVAMEIQFARDLHLPIFLWTKDDLGIWNFARL